MASPEGTTEPLRRCAGEEWTEDVFGDNDLIHEIQQSVEGGGVVTFRKSVAA